MNDTGAELYCIENYAHDGALNGYCSICGNFSVSTFIVFQILSQILVILFLRFTDEKEVQYSRGSGRLELPTELWEE